MSQLDEEFRYLQRKKNVVKELAEVRMRNITFLSNLTKFRVVPPHVILHMFKVCLDDGDAGRARAASSGARGRTEGNSPWCARQRCVSPMSLRNTSDEPRRGRWSRRAADADATRRGGEADATR